MHLTLYLKVFQAILVKMIDKVYIDGLYGLLIGKFNFRHSVYTLKADTLLSPEVSYVIIRYAVRLGPAMALEPMWSIYV